MVKIGKQLDLFDEGVLMSEWYPKGACSTISWFGFWSLSSNPNPGVNGFFVPGGFSACKYQGGRIFKQF